MRGTSVSCLISRIFVLIAFCRAAATQCHSGSQGTLFPPQGAVANAPTRGAGMQTRPAVGEALTLASCARCREVTWLLRAMAGVASMAVAISAAARSLSSVIEFLHWISKANTTWLLRIAGLASGDCRATESMRWLCYSASNQPTKRLDGRSIYSDELRLLG